MTKTLANASTILTALTLCLTGCADAPSIDEAPAADRGRIEAFDVTGHFMDRMAESDPYGLSRRCASEVCPIDGLGSPYAPQRRVSADPRAEADFGETVPVELAPAPERGTTATARPDAIEAETPAIELGDALGVRPGAYWAYDWSMVTETGDSAEGSFMISVTDDAREVVDAERGAVELHEVVVTGTVPPAFPRIEAMGTAQDALIAILDGRMVTLLDPRHVRPVHGLTGYVPGNADLTRTDGTIELSAGAARETYDADIGMTGADVEGLLEQEGEDPVAVRIAVRMADYEVGEQTIR